MRRLPNTTRMAITNVGNKLNYGQVKSERRHSLPLLTQVTQSNSSNYVPALDANRTYRLSSKAGSSSLYRRFSQAANGIRSRPSSHDDFNGVRSLPSTPPLGGAGAKPQSSRACFKAK